MPAFVPDFVTLLTATAAFALAAALAWTGRRFVKRVLARLDVINDENRAAVDARGRQVVRALQLLAYGIAVVFSVSLILSRLGYQIPAWSLREAFAWILVHGLHVILMLAGAYILTRAAHLAIEHLSYKVRRTDVAVSEAEHQRRAKTIAGALSNLVTVVVSCLTALMVLRELSIDVVPLLTGAGIAGLAVGFGAQNLVRDVISGFFVILENQVRVGDLARINNVSGAVEELNLRTIVLRDVEGAVHIFPNGAVTTLANLSKDFSYAVVDIAVARTEDLNRVFETLREIGSALQADPETGAYILAPLEIFGVETVSGIQATIRMRFKTRPLRQGDVSRALRGRIVQEFEARGIKRVG